MNVLITSVQDKHYQEPCPEDRLLLQVRQGRRRVSSLARRSLGCPGSYPGASVPLGEG